MPRTVDPTLGRQAVADASLKDKLKHLEADLAQARDDRKDLQAAVDKAQAAFASVPGYSTDSREFKEAEQAVRRLGTCDDRIAEMQAAQEGILRMLGRDTRPSSAFATGAPDDGRPAWDARHLLEDQSTRAALQEMSSSAIRVGRVALGQIVSRDQLAMSFGPGAQAADVTGTTAMRRGDFAGVASQLRRPFSVLDLLPTGTMDQNTIDYTVESGSFTTARETVEGTAKPEAAVVFTDAEAKAATIAHWLKNRKQVLADFPALESIIRNRLKYGVELRLEDEVVAGDGAGENIRGILNTTGVSTVAYSATELPADQILTGLTQVLLAHARSNGIVMNPLDWAAALKQKATGGDEQYYGGGPFLATPQVMWGTPLIPSAAIPQGTALVGDFMLGAQLFIREGVKVLISDADGNDFTENRVTILAEMRAALAVYRPACFSIVDLAA